MTLVDTKIKELGERKYPNPAGYNFYNSDENRVLFRSVYSESELETYDFRQAITFEEAGPREKIFFNPREVVAGIVTCGGLCPGINDVIRALVMELHYRYGVSRILGFRYGYAGLVEKNGYPPMELNPALVTDIVGVGGSLLSSSRGPQDVSLMADYLEKLGVNLLFAIGGDGTQRGALELSRTCLQRGLKLAIIGIPKTIDNDIPYIQKTFGFSTAVSEAVKAINAAHVEALGAPNGIGLVKLMGRHSGFIAANATLASRHVNFLLIPEKDFDLEGKNGFLEHLENRLRRRGHALVVVAEGAGQKFFGESLGEDKSGNKRLGDIGLFLKNKINEYFQKKGIEISLKYIDPSYTIRAVPANPEDAIFCGFLAQHAVHAAMAGKTQMVVGFWNNTFTHVPMELVASGRKTLKTEKSSLWRSVLATTGQSDDMTAKGPM
ncbi:MAG: ATP-dependent 6-phosphofructokinase [Leptospiraceae bacterium]|nr:ATP-dependent 6-phosphofructokinase [Leptospiraceae bacterium]MDW8305589.1 ATP-dependent 6-phosphofructokinase [Leptospiraceae bacterium]